MFTEAPNIIDRYQLAREAGFKAVESGFPFGFSIQEVAAAKTKAEIDQILLNVFTGIFLCLPYIVKMNIS
jgi:hydroxypyruvate isomerase